MVGLVSCYEVYNYGSQLMSYAMQMELDRLNIACEHINYVPRRDFHYICSLPLKLMNKQLREDKRRAAEERRLRKHSNSSLDLYHKKLSAFDAFVQKNIRASEPIIGYSELKKTADKYRCIVLGSDQVWGPMNLEGDYKNLMFVPDEIPKIVYGASFGVNAIPSNQKIRTRRYLNRIEHISVREMQGSEIIKQLTGRQVPVVLDPTLLFDIEQWCQIENTRYVPNKDYIFVYFLGKKTEARRAVLELKKRTGLKVVAIDMYPNTGLSYVDIPVDHAAPDDFIGLIRNAAMVCTDSFHGTVFSVLSRRNFATFLRDNAVSVTSANSRVESLLSQLDLENRVTDGSNIWSIMNQPIRYDSVYSKLSSLRAKSENYLIGALQKEGVL